MIRLDCAIATVNRAEGYLARTIQSLRTTRFFDEQSRAPVRLVVGSADAMYVDGYKAETHKFAVEKLTREEEAVERGYDHPARRCASTHVRCLRGMRPNADVLLLLEDDVEFARGWLPRVYATATELQSAFPRGWVLALFTPGGSRVREMLQRGKKWFQRDYGGFYAAQALLYSRSVVKDYVPHAFENCVRTPIMPMDLYLPVWMKERGLPILSTAPSLAQHIGVTSTGCGGGAALQSDCFMADLSAGV